MNADARLNEATGEYQYVGVGLQRANMQEYDFFLQDAWRALRRHVFGQRVDDPELQ